MTSRERTWPTFFAFDVADYLGGTLDFDVKDHGCYLLLLLAQFNSREAFSIPPSPRDLKVICKGQKPSARVLKKFHEVQVDAERRLRNDRMQKEARKSLEAWRDSVERRAAWKARKRRQRGGDVSADVPRDNERDVTGDAPREGTALERERDTSSLSSDVDTPAEVRAGGASSATEQPHARSHSPRGKSGRENGSGPSTPVDYDQNDPLQANVAAYCERLAQLEADAEGTGPVTPEDIRRVLQIVSTTPSGSHLSGLRNASRSWLETTLETCQRFERENYG